MDTGKTELSPEGAQPVRGVADNPNAAQSDRYPVEDHVKSFADTPFPRALDMVPMMYDEYIRFRCAPDTRTWQEIHI
jgi:hypothetical protein